VVNGGILYLGDRNLDHIYLGVVHSYTSLRDHVVAFFHRISHNWG
jgi:hypothetical protein